MNKSYGHDMHGALARGYWRRARKAAADLWENCRGAGDPMNPMRRKDSLVFAMAFDTLCEQAARSGCSFEDMEFWWTGSRIERKREEIARKVARPAQEWTEDPSATKDGFTDWTEFDAYVETLRERDLRILLRKEARLRDQAQRELAASR